MGAIKLATSTTTDEEYGGTFATQATEVAYDNTQSGLTADDVQEAIDELQAKKAQITHISTFGPIAINGTFQLTQDLLNHEALLVVARRYGVAGSAILFVSNIKNGLYTSGIGISMSVNSGYNITVSQAGLVTLTAITGSLGEPNFDIVGIV